MVRPIVCLALLSALLTGRSLPAQQPSIRPVSATESARWREDLRYLAERMPKVHPNLYHEISRRKFIEALHRLDRRIPSLARHEIIVELARLAASVGDGHTNVAPARDAAIGFHGLPVILYPFSDGLYVRAADSAHASLVGARVVGIGRITAEEAIAAVTPLIGRDNEMGALFTAPFLLVMPEVLQALGLIESLDSVPLLLEHNGARRSVVLAPNGPASRVTGDADRSWEVLPGWVDARGPASGWPRWLRQPEDKFWFELLPAHHALYVQYNEVSNKEDMTVAQFTDRLFGFARSHSVERLVLDLRLNGGGHGELNRPLLLGLIRAESLDVHGRLFVLIGRRTFSAAQFLVSDLEQLSEAMFVGEPTASRGNHYGDSRRIVLPNSGVTVRVSTLYWQHSDPRDDRVWTAPGIATDLSFDDYRHNRDPALEAALDWVPEPSLADRAASALTAGGARALDTAYRAYVTDPRHRFVESENPLNALGYELLQGGRTADALAVFTLNARAHPGSANVHDSRGEALVLAGDTAAAVREYTEAHRLDPASQNATDKLRALRVR